MYLTRAAVFIFCVTFCVIQARHTGNKVRDLLLDLLDQELNDINTRGSFHHKRIINGEAVKSSWPWLVSLKTFEAATGEISYHFCGASLLNTRWLLTAGHCFGHDTEEEVNAKLDTFQARLGDKEVKASAEEVLKNDVAQFINGLGDLELEQEEINELLDWMDWQVDFEKVIIHPEYVNSGAQPNDIALVKLAKDVPAMPEVVSRIQSVNLPEQTDDISWPPEGANCTLKGWGCTEVGGRVVDLLRKTNLTILSTCDEIPMDAYAKTSYQTRICAGTMPTEEDIENFAIQNMKINNPELFKIQTEEIGGEEAMEQYLKEHHQWASGGSGGCPGDSGGPLMCERDGEWVQAGVASWIMATSTETARRFPTVFTRVSHYVDWIHQTIAEN